MYSIILDKKIAEREQIIQISEKTFDFHSIQEEQCFSISNTSKDKSVLIKFLCPTHFQYNLIISNSQKVKLCSSNSLEQENVIKPQNQNSNSEQFSTFNSLEIFANQTVEFNLSWNEEGEKDLETNSNWQQSQQITDNKPLHQQQPQQFQGESIQEIFENYPIIQLQHNYRDKIVILTSLLESNIDYNHDIELDEDCENDIFIHNQNNQKHVHQNGIEDHNQSIQSDSTTSMTSIAQQFQTFRVISGNLQMQVWSKLDKKRIFKQELVINNFFLTQNNPTYSCLFVQKIMECQIFSNKKVRQAENKANSQENEKQKGEQIQQKDEDNMEEEGTKIDENKFNRKINIPIDRHRAIARVNITPLGSYEGAGNSREQMLKDMLNYRSSNCQCCGLPFQECFQSNLKITKEQKDIISMHVKNSIDQHQSMIFENNTVLFQFDKINKQLKDFSSDIWVLQEDLSQELGVQKIIYFFIGKQSNQNYFAIQERQNRSKANSKNAKGNQITNSQSQFCNLRNSTASQNSQCSQTVKGVSSSSYSSNLSNPMLNYLKTGKSSDDQNLLSSDTESVENSSSPLRNQASNRQSINHEEYINGCANRQSYDTNFPSSSSQNNFSELNTPTNQKRNSNIITPRQIQDKGMIKTSNSSNNLTNTEIQQNQCNKNSPIMNADTNRNKEIVTFQTIYEIGGEEENSFRDQNQFMKQHQYAFDFPLFGGNTNEDEKFRQTAPVPTYDMSNNDRSININMYKSLVPAKDSSDLNCFESEDFRKSKLKQPRSKKEGSITTEQKNIKHIILSDDSLFFITATECGLVTVWNISTQQKTIFEHHKQSTDPSINFLKSMNDNDRFMTGGGDRTIKIYSLKKMQLIHTIDVKRKIVHSAAILPDLDMIAVGGLNVSKLVSLGKVTKRRNIKFYSLSNYKYLKKFKIPSTENVITHMEYCQSKYNSCFQTEEDRKTKSNTTLPSSQQYRESACGTKTESSDNECGEDRYSMKSISCKSVCSPKLTKMDYSILACVVQGSYGSRLIFIQFGKKGKMEIILNCEMLTIGVYIVHRFYYSQSLQKIICMPKPKEKKGQTIKHFFEIDITSTSKIESIKHTPSFEKPIIDLNLCSDQNIIIVIPSENYFYLYDVKDQAIIDRSNTLEFHPKQAYVSSLNFAAIQLESGNGKINIFKLPSQLTS